MKHFIFILVCTLTMGSMVPAKGQILKKIKNKVESSIDRRVDRKIDKTVEGTLDKTEEEIGSIGKEKPEATGSSQQPETNGDVVQTGNNNTGAVDNINVGQDFIPGERTIYQTDFSKTPVTNFPRDLEFRNGEISVVHFNNQAVLQFSSSGGFAIKLPNALPEKFTIEFSMMQSYFTSKSSIHIVDAAYKDAGKHHFEFSRKWGTGVRTSEKGVSTSFKDGVMLEQKLRPVQIMADGSYVKVYVDGIRVANIPNADLGRSSVVLFNSEYEVSTTQPMYITDIRIAAGGRDLYQTLTEEGRVAFNDIHFATGKADILSESSETIGQIAQLLKEHSDLNLLIEGHTDNTGSFDSNMDLSKRRADAVKNYLVTNHGIAENRLRSVGLGQTRPVDSNETETGRANNRRVEIVKM